MKLPVFSLFIAAAVSQLAAGDVALSLPAWTPGAYEISNFARYVMNFSASDGAAPLAWDKLDQDTWRIHVTRAGEARVSFEYLAMTLDNAAAWSKPEFVFFNGTNVFLYPEAQSSEFASTVTIHTMPSWRIATGMTQTGANTFTASNYHDLVDMPTFVGKFDFDSTLAGGKWMRFASYPADSMEHVHGAPGRGFGIHARKRKRPRAPELALRHSVDACRRQSRARVTLRSRDFSRVERQAIAAE